MGMSRLNQYLYNKRGRWQYTRRVPSEVAHLDRRGTIRVSLKTDSLDVARHRRDAMMLADDEYWGSCKKMNAAAQFIVQPRRPARCFHLAYR